MCAELICYENKNERFLDDFVVNNTLTAGSLYL